MEINKNILIEDLLAKYPDAVTLLMKKGIQSVACGE
jgi:hypothetical protein